MALGVVALLTSLLIFRRYLSSLLSYFDSLLHGEIIWPVKRLADGRTFNCTQSTTSGHVTKMAIKPFESFNPPKTPWCTHTYFMARSMFYIIGLKICRIRWNKRKIRAITAFKVIELGTNRKPVCDFLLVINSNWHSILYRFGVIAAYSSNLGQFVFLSHPLGGRGRASLGTIRCSSLESASELLALIELFSLGVTAEALRANIASKSQYLLTHLSWNAVCSSTQKLEHLQKSKVVVPQHSERKNI